MINLKKLTEKLWSQSVHKIGDETITGAKTFTEKLFLTPKEGDRWAETYIYGTENTAKYNANIGNTPIGIGWEGTTAFSIGTMNNSNSTGNTSWIAVGPWK